MKLTTKRDTRTENEIRIDETIEILVRQADTPEKIAVVLELMNKRKKSKKDIPWGAIITGSVGLIQILAIIHHEKLNVITSKALGFVMRGRV